MGDAFLLIGNTDLATRWAGHGCVQAVEPTVKSHLELGAMAGNTWGPRATAARDEEEEKKRKEEERKKKGKKLKKLLPSFFNS